MKVLLRSRLGTIELGGANDRKDLRALEWIVGFRQLLIDRNGQNGGDGGGGWQWCGGWRR
jgi:hypothetical protein